MTINPYDNQIWTAAKFVEFMEQVWEIHSTPASDGGITLRESRWYKHWENALDSARHLGARRTGGTRVGGEPAHLFRFPADHGWAGVAIAYNGAVIRLSSQRFGARRSKEIE